jgi:hypothetical protein
MAKQPILFAINYKNDAIDESGEVLHCNAEDDYSIAQSLDKILGIDAIKRAMIDEWCYRLELECLVNSVLSEKFFDKVYPDEFFFDSRTDVIQHGS